MMNHLDLYQHHGRFMKGELFEVSSADKTLFL